MPSSILQVSIEKLLRSADGDARMQYSFNLSKGEIIGIQGPSGSGKTSLLKMISGLITPDLGTIKFDEQYWFHHKLKKNISTKIRNIGYVFQDMALFPSMTLSENVAFGFKNSSKYSINQWLDLMKLTNLGDRYPNQVSGGQAQRIAIARALATDPQLLLLDEPFTGLDEAMKNQIILDLKSILNSINIPVIMVSHDLYELINFTNVIYKISDHRLIELSVRSKAKDYRKLEGRILDIDDINHWVYVFTGIDIVKIHAEDINDDNLQIGKIISVQYTRSID